MYCINCGMKLSDDSRFCTSCGTPQLVQEEQSFTLELKETDREVIQKKQKTNNITQQQKKIYTIVFVAIAIIVIAFLSAKNILTDIYSPEKLATEYIEAIRTQNINKFKELTDVRGGGYDETGVWVDSIEDVTMTDEEIQTFLSRSSSDEEMLVQYYNELVASISNVTTINHNQEKGMLYIEEESSNILYTKYKVVFNKPVVNISSNMEGA